MESVSNTGGGNPPFAHMIFFKLSDTSKTVVRDFIGLCVKYLSNHAGQQHFSVGTRALQISRDVSAKNFDIAVHMIFSDISAYQAYAQSAQHEDFITQSAGMSPERIVYDSFVQEFMRTKETH
jgi:hypothetical protein